MNEELEQFIQEVKSILPWLLAAGIVVAGYHGVRKYVRDRRAAAAESVSSAYTTEELEDAAAKFKGSKAEGVLRLRLAKSYFDSANYDSALEIYESLDGKAPDGFADVVAVGKAQCLEGLGRFDEAQKAFDAFAEANEKSFLALTAKLGSARCVAQAGNRDKAIEDIMGTDPTCKPLRWHVLLKDGNQFTHDSSFIASKYESAVAAKQAFLNRKLAEWYNLPKVETEAE